MKTTLIGSLLLLSSMAFAADQGQRESIQCTDPSLAKYFNTIEEAQNSCPQANNVFVTYDWVYQKYTCACYNDDNNGGE